MPSSCPISGCVTLGGAFPSRSLIFSSLNGQEYLRSQSSSRSCGLCPPLRGDEVRGGGGGVIGEERQARTGIRILLREAPALKVGGWNWMLPLSQLQES